MLRLTGSSETLHRQSNYRRMYTKSHVYQCTMKVKGKKDCTLNIMAGKYELLVFPKGQCQGLEKQMACDPTNI